MNETCLATIPNETRLVTIPNETRLATIPNENQSFRNGIWLPVLSNCFSNRKVYCPIVLRIHLKHKTNPLFYYHIIAQCWAVWLNIYLRIVQMKTDNDKGNLIICLYLAQKVMS
jgi:hypothetical protein